jgi:hypothetical protein
MKFIFYYNAKVINLLIVIFSLSFCSQICKAQDDPIKQDLEKEKQEYLGAKLSQSEAEELKRINTKYAISDKETELRSKQRSGQKIGMMDKIRLMRANRKDYMRTKKFEQFKQKKVMGIQSEKTKKRMQDNKKRTESKYKKEKNRKKRKSFFNLFK